MQWRLITRVCLLIIVSLRVHQLEAKLTLELSPKSSEILSNTIYSGNNNEISDFANNNDNSNDNQNHEVALEDAIQRPVIVEEELSGISNDVEGESKLPNQMKAATQVIGKNHFHAPLNQSNFIDEATKQAKEKEEEKEEEKRINMKPMKIRATATTTTTTKPTPSARISTQRPGLSLSLSPSFINPFGQLSAFFGSDQLHYLQDYNFLFNAEKHTIFQLHTLPAPVPVKTTSTSTSTSTGTSIGTTSAGRVLNTVVGGTLGAALGVNSASAAGVTASLKVEEVHFYNAASLRQSRFNPFNPTRILIHGWFGGSHAGVYNTLVPEYLKLENGSYNIFTVDWGRGAIADYITASYRVKPVGKVVAKFIDFLHRESGMRFEDLHVIGFSMGAHIAGIAGKFVQTGRLPIIYGLDPALPLFRYENIDERIALTDADYVEIIHTSVGSYGYDRPLGHVDFYVNYGSGQPGCFFNECSHFRAFQVFAESLHNPNAFCGQGCDVKLWSDLIKNRRCLMGTGRNLTMGGNPTDAVALRKRGGGVYFLTTNANSPYGRN